MENRELGSEFSLPLGELTRKNDNIVKYLSPYSYSVFFDSGRSALKHLASKMLENEEVLLPEFICESVITCFDTVNFYKLNNDFSINLKDLKDKIRRETKYIFLMHYFGHVQPKDTLDDLFEIACKNGCIIIEDTTHNIFSSPSTVGDYQICSIRKWLPISGGGVLYSRDDKLKLFDNIGYHSSVNNDRTYGMILKDMFLRYDYDFNKQYRQIFERCDRQLDNQEEIFLMSDLSGFIAECVDFKELIERRIKNYDRLKKKVTPAIPIENEECPLVLPLMVKNRDRLRAYLMENRIYCAVHWPFDNYLPDKRPFASMCAEHLISLPIDQRYGEDDMDYMIEILGRYGDLEI